MTVSSDFKSCPEGYRVGNRLLLTAYRLLLIAYCLREMQVALC